MWGPRPDVGVADVLLLEVPVEAGLKFRAVIRLHDAHAEGQPAQNLIDKRDRRRLIARVIHLEDPNARAIVDRCD